MRFEPPSYARHAFRTKSKSKLPSSYARHGRLFRTKTQNLIWQCLPGYQTGLAFVKRATKKGYDENGQARPRAPGFKGGATPITDPEEQELSAVSHWQRTDGPFYVQFTGAAMLLVGFLNHFALYNQNGSGIAGLSQSLFAMGILVLMLGFAVERKGPDE